MKTKIIIAVMLVCSCSFGADLSVCLEYLYPEAPVGSWTLTDLSDGNGVRISEWNLPSPKPTKQQLLDVWPQAEIWAKTKRVSEESDISKMPEQFRAVIRALVKTINVRLPAGQKITEDELVTAIKAELQ